MNERKVVKSNEKIKTKAHSNWKGPFRIIQRSLSMKGCPYDNAEAEATFKVFKTEFANQAHLSSLEQLALERDDYVHWFNNIRIHGTLGYLTPMEFKLQPT